ncbi:MAG: uroporphyrinogen decarboxylase family protein [Candidatus Korobacteraceae bacterium]|jgi:hypothetical protein
MKTNAELYNERLARIKTAVALEKPDRVPVIPLGTSFCARHLGVKLAAFASDPKLAHETIMKSFTSLGEIDAIQQPTFSPHLLSFAWLSKVQLPGIDLPEDSPWQVQEAELMSEADYDVIINKGWTYFYGDFMLNRLDNLMAKLGPTFGFTPTAIKNCTDAGLVCISPVILCSPFEIICGARSMGKFFRDMSRIPDKVQAALDVAQEQIKQDSRGAIRAFGCTGVWVGGWRGASELVSPKIWNRFVWPYFKQLVELADEEGVLPILHMDANWGRDLERFKELPKAKCVFAGDHATNIFKIKEVLGDHMCIMGDVPATMLSLGTPDDVHAYSTKLIHEIGPAGFILSSGCDIPFDAKPENVAAMIAAVH